MNEFVRSVRGRFPLVTRAGAGRRNRFSVGPGGTGALALKNSWFLGFRGAARALKNSRFFGSASRSPPVSPVLR